MQRRRRPAVTPNPAGILEAKRQKDTEPARCQGCGGHVTRRFLRVCGDNTDTVYRCPHCAGQYDSDRQRWSQPDGGER